jgi:hypothetical protein
MVFRETMVTMLESELWDDANAMTTNMLKSSTMLQGEEINQFGHRWLIDFSMSEVRFCCEPFSAILLFPALTRLFTYMYFSIPAATLIIPINNYFIKTSLSYENNSTSKMNMLNVVDK